MVFSLKGKNKRLAVFIYALVAVLILALGVYFVLRNRPSADTDSSQSGNQRDTTSLFDKTVGIWNAGNEKREEGGQEAFTYREYISSIMKDVDVNLPIEDQSTFLADTLMEEMQVVLGGAFEKERIGADYTKQKLVSSIYDEFKDGSEALIRVCSDKNTGQFDPDLAIRIMDDLFGGGIDDVVDLSRASGKEINLGYAVVDTTKTGSEGFDVRDSLGTADYEAYISTMDARKVVGNLPVVADLVRANEAAKKIVALKSKDLNLSDNDMNAITAVIENTLKADSAGILAKANSISTQPVRDNTPTSADTGATDDSEDTDLFTADFLAAERATFPLFQGDGTIAVNPQTGNAEYRTTLCYDTSGDGSTCLAQGYISFDPTNNSFSAQASAVFAGKRVGLYSDPISGDVYMSLSNDGSEALYKAGKVELMSAMVSSDGKFGGEFKYADRVFRYNPSTSAFEVPIAIGNKGSLKIGQNAEEGDRGTIYIDSNGNVSGKVDVDLGKSLGSASVFLSSSGVVTVAKTITSGGQSLGSIGISSEGGISGSINVGKVIGMNSFFVGFGSGGITGVTIPIGSFGVSIGKSGALSIGTFIPVAGLPIPVGIGQAADGGFRLTWPGGSLGLFGGDDRSQTPPELSKDEDGATDAGCIYFRHSYKKGFMTVRVYQEPCTKIAKEEQVQRSKMIFDVYNDLLGRNPGLQEFAHWYFYSGHQLYKFPQHEEDKAYRMEATEEALRKFITGKGAYDRAKEGGLGEDNKEEYKWIKDGKAPLDAPTRPDDILESNPFEATASETTPGSSDETQLTPIKDFLDALLEDMENDPGYYLSKFFDEELDEVTNDNQVNIDYDIDEETSADTSEEATATITSTAGAGSTATATATATATETESDEIQTILVSRQGDYPVIEKTTDNNNLIITLRKGFNEIFVPSEVGYVNVKGIRNDGMVVFEYDPTYNSDPNKSWNTNIETLKPGTGYYLYNKGKADRKIRLAKRPDLGTGEKNTALKVGWNLLSQSDQSSVILGNYAILAAKEGWSGGCDIVGLCVENNKMSDLILTSGEKSRAYKKVYFLIPDSDPLKVKKFVEADVVKGDNLNKIELKQGQMFWVYLFE